MTSCIAVSRSSASSPYFFARAISSGDARELVERLVAGARSSAWLLPRNRKFLVPYFSWISFSFGRLSPIVVDVEVAGLDQDLDRLDHRRL